MIFLLELILLANQGLGQPATGNVFVPTKPCRVADSRFPNAVLGLGAPALAGNTSRTIPIRQSQCGIPQEATAYSLNVTVVPHGPLAYLTLWPTGQPQPLVSTLNSFEGKVVANAALVPAGTLGSIEVFVANSTDVIVDINGFFLPPSDAATPIKMTMLCTGPNRPQITVVPPGGPPAVITPCVFQLEPRFQFGGFVPIQPCRVADTRSAYPGPLTDAIGAPSWFQGTPVPRFTGASTRTFPVPKSNCALSPSALAYSLNSTVVPRSQLSYLTLFPSGQAQPLVSTLNSFDGRIVANAAIVPAGANGTIDAFVTDDTELIIDANGYFGNTPGSSSLLFYPVQPCRMLDTRLFVTLPSGSGEPSRWEVNPPATACGIPTNARALSLNVTAVPRGPLAYLTVFPTGQPQPNVSTLNAFQGQVTANAAIVPAGINGRISIFGTDPTHVVVDVNGYFR